MAFVIVAVSSLSIATLMGSSKIPHGTWQRFHETPGVVANDAAVAAPAAANRGDRSVRSILWWIQDYF